MNEQSMFWIKAGDLLPVLRAALTDRSGSPIPLGAAESVTFRMSDGNGTIIVNTAGDVSGDPDAGIVQYAWKQGDTDIAGDYFAEWVVEFPNTEPQTFPTNGYNRVSIAAVLGGALEDVLDLRKATGETGDTMFTDAEMQRYLLNRQGEKEAAAYDVWMDKAAEYARLTDITEGSSTRNNTALFKNAVTMAERYYALSPTIGVIVTTAPRTRRIVRP